MLFPLYHVLADVGRFAGGTALATAASHPLQVDGLALRAGPRLRVLVAKMTAEPRDVRVQDLGVDRVQVCHLDECSFGRATRDGDGWRAETGETHVTDGGSLQLHLLP